MELNLSNMNWCKNEIDSLRAQLAELTALVGERVETFKALTGVQIGSIYIELTERTVIESPEPDYVVTGAHVALSL